MQLSVVYETESTTWNNFLWPDLFLILLPKDLSSSSTTELSSATVTEQSSQYTSFMHSDLVVCMLDLV